MHRFERISNIDLILQVTTTPAVTTAEVNTTVVTTMPTTPAPVASLILIAGSGLVSNRATVELLTGSNQKQLANLPTGSYGPSLINHYGDILICGGYASAPQQSCFQLSNGPSWLSHSSLNTARYHSGAATTNSGSFIFGGGSSSRGTFEYMTKGDTNWQTGNQYIPNGFESGCVIKISDEILYLIGGISSASFYERRILAFNTTLSTKLITGRSEHSCEFIPNTNKVMISGGYGYNVGNLYVTEVLDITTGSTSHGPAMNLKRGYHGSGIITVDGEDRLAVFGGAGSSRRDSIELFNPQTNSWQMMSETLTEPKHAFGFLTIKEGDINDFLL